MTKSLLLNCSAFLCSSCLRRDKYHPPSTKCNALMESLKGSLSWASSSSLRLASRVYHSWPIKGWGEFIQISIVAVVLCDLFMCFHCVVQVHHGVLDVHLIEAHGLLDSDAFGKSSATSSYELPTQLTVLVYLLTLFNH